MPLEDSIGALVALKEEGKIRHIGLSNVNEDQLRRAQAMTAIVSIQNRYNPRPQVGHASRPVRAGGDGLCRGRRSRTSPILGAPDIAKRHEATVHQIALAWLLARSQTMLTIPGTGSVDHLEENVAAAGLRLDPEEIAAFNDLG